MKLIFSQQSNLPRSAWLAETSDKTTRIFYGDQVQRFENGIFEGGWSLCDTPAHCAPSGWYAGSGVFLHEGGLKAISPSHTLESVYVVKAGSRTFASNSMALVCVASGWHDFLLSSAGSNLWAVSMGIKNYPRKIATSTYRTLLRYCMSIIDLETLSEKAHEPRYEFTSFATYESFVRVVASDVLSTSNSKECAVYLSRGYDSVACAGLASTLGGGNSLSLAKGRTGLDDNGMPIARLLKLEPYLITPLHRPTFVKNGQTYTRFSESDAPEVSEFCVGFGIEDECLSVPPSLVENRLVLTGFHGDKVWDVNEPPNDYIRRGDSSGSSLYEFKLRAGFTHLPVPMIGVLRHSDIHRISNSGEMAPWRLGNNYDRPIPRRIGEEAGVPREVFGQRKSAAATASEPLGHLKDVYFDALMRRYAYAANLTETGCLR